MVSFPSFCGVSHLMNNITQKHSPPGYQKKKRINYYRQQTAYLKQQLKIYIRIMQWKYYNIAGIVHMIARVVMGIGIFYNQILSISIYLRLKWFSW